MTENLKDDIFNFPKSSLKISLGGKEMESLEKIIQFFKKEGKIGKIIVKKKNDKNFLIIFKNQGFSIEIQANTITIKGTKDNNNSFQETAERAEEIKHILKKMLNNSEIIIEVS